MIKNQETKVPMIQSKKKIIAELEEKNDYSNLMFATTTEKFYDFSKYRNPSILFDEIRRGKIKVYETSDFQNKFKLGSSDIKKGIKIRSNDSTIEILSPFLMQVSRSWNYLMIMQK